MHSQLMIQEMVGHLERERVSSKTRQGRSIERPTVPGKGAKVAVFAVIGEVLVRAGRFLLGGTVSRPAPVNS
jgi:hypothetical protein